MRRLLAITVVLALAAAAPASAAKGDRADARAFAAATKELRAAVLAQKPALEETAHRLDRDPACLETFRHVPERAADEATALIFEYSFEALVSPIMPAFTRFIERLDAVKVRDRRLRSGRAAQRRTGRAVRLVQPPPADVCQQLDAWRRAGYPENTAPKIDDPAFAEAAELPAHFGRDIERAARRMRELGVSRRVGRLWTGDDNAIYKGIDIAVEIPLGEANP